jgi:hypothetical protein
MATGLDPEFPGDESNPYAPPRSQIGQRSQGQSPIIVPFDLGCILSATWAIFKQRLGACLAACLTVLTLTFGTQYLQTLIVHELAMAPGDRLRDFLVRFGILFGGYVFHVWLSIGQNLAMLALARGEPAVVERIFHGGRFILTTILAAVLFTLALGLIVLLNLIWIPVLSGLVGHSSVAMVMVMAVAFTIACVVAIYVAMRFSQFPFMILDHNAGAADSLHLSWEATRRRVGTLNVVYTMLFLINLGGFLACFVGLIFTLPFTGLMLAVTYLSMMGQPLGGKKPAPGPWDEVSFEAD